ncbi:MAG: ABC transporter substrate-binding protein [Deltaproteobacteria bacterium]|nr:ABC transporter substrate-binding protein [Deltaproteobacteria bacterium]MBI2180091.1 ABC transporter substrate-binding protein [Deltaproteobacteria bacterium]MBI2227772.1 ABC transporter substrate-binding protein [Deltaproteobacteria bacterium]MBI2535052.1 ABC transporter substrate-binding protein [Deltaproteobacteria bacterium]
MKSRLWLFVFTAIFQILVVPTVKSAELPVVRLAHAAFNEKVVALWLGVEQGFFRKHGVEVQLVYIRTGPQTIAALSGGEIQIIYTIPSVVLSAAAGGMDLAMFGGIVNKAEGDIVAAPSIRSPEDLKGKRIGVQSIGGGIWSQTMLALEHFGLEPTRDKINIMVIGGDQSVIAQALATGTIDAAYLGYTFSSSLKARGFRVLVDLGKAAIPYQGLALIGRNSYLKQNAAVADGVLRGVLEAVAFVQTPARKEAVIKSLLKNLRLSDARDAESGYNALQWLYNLDVAPEMTGIRNMQRLLATTNPKVKAVRAEDVVNEDFVRRVRQTAFYRELVERGKKR